MKIVIVQKATKTVKPEDCPIFIDGGRLTTRK